MNLVAREEHGNTKTKKNWKPVIKLLSNISQQFFSKHIFLYKIIALFISVLNGVLYVVIQKPGHVLHVSIQNMPESNISINFSKSEKKNCLNKMCSKLNCAYFGVYVFSSINGYLKQQ